MDLSIVTLLLYFSVFLIGAATVSRLYQLNHVLAYKALMLAFLGHCIASAASIGVFAFAPLELKILSSRLRFLGFSIISPSMLIFINSLYFQWKWLDKRSTLFVLYVPAAITWIITLVPALRPLMVRDFAAVTIGAFNVLQFKPGPWFPYHLLSCYLSTALMMVLAFWAFLREKFTRRRQLAFVCLATLSTTFLDFYAVIANPEWRWIMFSGAAFVLVDIAVLYAGLKHKLFELVPYATEKVFQSLSEPILILDSDSCLQTANRAALELFGLQREHYGQAIDVALGDLKLGDGQILVKDKHYDVRSESISGEPGPVAGRIITLREITRWIEVEKSLNSHLKLKSTILSMISHDVLGNMRAQAALMRNFPGKRDDATRDLVEVLVNSHETVHQFMRNVLNWEKMHHQKFVLMRSAFDLKMFVDQSCEVLELTASLRTLSIVRKFEDARRMVVKADSEVLGCILRNLLANAINASHEGGEIEILVRVESDELIFEVIDKGQGMDEDRVRDLLSNSQLPKDPILSLNGGFGFGLALSQYFTRLHSGRFWITSELGTGSRIGFSVPLTL